MRKQINSNISNYSIQSISQYAYAIQSILQQNQKCLNCLNMHYWGQIKYASKCLQSHASKITIKGKYLFTATAIKTLPDNETAANICIRLEPCF